MRIVVDGVSFAYGSTDALSQISFEAGAGDIIGIIGHNGCGKTTLLKCINRTLQPREGVVFIDGKDAAELGRKEIAREVGVVAQSTTITFPFTVMELVVMGRFPKMERFQSEKMEDLQVVQNAMRATNIEYLADRPIDEVSGGERQRVIIARALSQEPRALLLDEPTLHLDIDHQYELMDLVRSLAKQRGMLVIMVSHDINLSARYCDKLILMRQGRIVAAGNVVEVLTPANMEMVFHVRAEVDLDPRTKAYNITILEHLPRDVDRTRNDS